MSNQFKILINLKNKSQLKYYINLNESLFNRKIIPSIEHFINKEWSIHTSNSSFVYNDQKFRYHSFNINNSSISLNIGITSYKDFLGTNQSIKIVDEIKDKIDNKNTSLLSDYLANPLGCGALILTKDIKYLLIKRSNLCSEYSLYWDIPGGYAEPKLVDLNNNLQIEQELFNLSILRELKEELNIDCNYLNKLKLLGIITNREKYDKPNLQFLIETNLTSNEIENLYRTNKQIEANETCGILFITEQEYKDNERTESEFWRNLTPSAKSAFHLIFE